MSWRTACVPVNTTGTDRATAIRQCLTGALTVGDVRGARDVLAQATDAERQAFFDNQAYFFGLGVDPAVFAAAFEPAPKLTWLAYVGLAVLVGGGGYWAYRRWGLPRSLGRERIPGGKAKGMKPSDFDPEQLRIGTKVEMEHTTSRLVAREIAMDHLVEDPNYYRKLRRFHLD